MPARPALHHVRFAGAPRTSRRAGTTPSCAAPASAKGDASPPQSFPAWLLSHAGLDSDAYRPLCLERRTPACLRRLGARSVDEARRRVEADPSFVPVAVSTLLIGVTGFFRDADVFGALASQVIPPLASLPHPPRVWSAACSSGEELYSVGVLLEAGGLRDAELLGTDCRPDAIDEARACGGTRTFLEHLGPYLSTFALARLDLEAAVASVRGHARWKVSSIVDGVEPGPWDMVLWRNLAIYLTADAVARVYSRLVQAIRPGGFLVLGKAERPPEGMQLVSVARCIYRRTGGADAGP